MKCTLFFFGGVNYSAPTDADGEEFDSIQAAERTFWRRADFDPHFPCVENPEGWIVLGHDVIQENVPDFILTIVPDFILTIGPRGGIRRERA